MSLRDVILARLALTERDEESAPLGGTVRLREFTRAQLRAASEWSATVDKATREHARGAALAVAVQAALGGDDPRDDLRRALTIYYLGAPETATDIDKWHAAIVASGALDPETGQPVFEREELLTWPSRGALWDEIARLAQAILDLSGVGSAALKSGDLEAPPE